MKYGARLQTVIEILDRIASETHIPADNIVNDYLRQRRFIGSSDRRFITDLVYDILKSAIKYNGFYRALLWQGQKSRAYVLCHLHSQDNKLEDVALLFSGEAYHPKQLTVKEEHYYTHLKSVLQSDLTEGERLGVLDWSLNEFKANFPDSFVEEIAALVPTAPFDLRVNTLKTYRQFVMKSLKKDGYTATETPYSPTGLRLNRRTSLSQHEFILDGSIEIQDEGSQLVAALVAAQPGMTVMDYCAGAGGKTLAIAATMANKGRIMATDTIAWRLERGKERFKRAGVSNVESRVLTPETNKWLKRQESRFDRVLVDVPCTGSGTWRRNPDLRWRMSEKDLIEIIHKQREILDNAKKLVKQGGRLIYATCSMYNRENHQQITDFLDANPDFKVIPVSEVWSTVLSEPCPTEEPLLQLTPHRHQTDGFFVAILERETR